MPMLPSLLIAFFLLPFHETYWYPPLAAPELFWEHSWEQALPQRGLALRHLSSYFEANLSDCAGIVKASLT